MSNALIPPRLNADGYPTRLYMVSTLSATGAFISFAPHVWNESASAYEFSIGGVDYVLEVSGGNWVWGTAGLSTTGPSSAGSPVGRYTPDDSGVRFDLVASPPPNANTAEVSLSPGAPGTNTAEVSLSPGAPGSNTAEVSLSPGAPGANTAEVTLSPGAPGALIPEV